MIAVMLCARSFAVVSMHSISSGFAASADVMHSRKAIMILYSKCCSPGVLIIVVI